MRNFDRSDRDESPARFFGPFISGYLVGSIIAGVVNYHLGESDQDNLREVQLQNEQVQSQLDTQYPGANTLVINTKDKTFTFKMSEAGGDSESCNGSYKVDRIASIVGDVSCTQVVQPATSPTN